MTTVQNVFLHIGITTISMIMGLITLGIIYVTFGYDEDLEKRDIIPIIAISIIYYILLSHNICNP